MSQDKATTEQPAGQVRHHEQLVVPAPLEAGVSSAIAKAELDQAVTTARAFPRSLALFRRRCAEMATLNVTVAAQCTYKLPPRKSDDEKAKAIDGPSARMGEIVLATYGNCRAAARILEIGPQFVVAQGVFHDLESNVQSSTEVRRRITGRTGHRYSDDMIGVTSNAACSIAKRNAIFQGIPRALWDDIHEAAKTVAKGKVETLAKRREEALSKAKDLGIDDRRVFAVLQVSGGSDITLDKLADLNAFLQAIADGDISAEEAFPPIAGTNAGSAASTSKKGVGGLKARIAAVKSPEDLHRDLCIECARLASDLGWDAAAVHDVLQGAGVVGAKRWNDLTVEHLLPMRAMMLKALGGAEQAKVEDPDGPAEAKP